MNFYYNYINSLFDNNLILIDSISYKTFFYYNYLTSLTSNALSINTFNISSYSDFYWFLLVEKNNFYNKSIFFK